MQQNLFEGIFMPLDYILQGDFTIIVAFSGGKDSIAMVLYLLEQGVKPTRIHLHHHEVDGHGPNLFDWPCTRSYCGAFAEAFGLRIFYSYREGGIMREVYRNNEPRQDILFQREPGGPYSRIPAKRTALNTRLKFPAVSANMQTRWCSSSVKISVLLSLVCHHPLYQGQFIVLTGERREESSARRKYAAIESFKASTKTRRALQYRILLDWTELAVWNILARWNIQPHPAYMLGWPRCSCQLCIFNHPDVWATIATISPDKLDQIAATETDIHFTLYHGKSIQDVAREGQAFTDLDPFWVSQALGAFTAPIRPGNWTLPKGAFKKQAAGAW
jgi:3'-phosphoadenosine 5'-phosphosulfate sulfotransferase (PAPS reductase)/FAD synthetase